MANFYNNSEDYDNNSKQNIDSQQTTNTYVHEKILTNFYCIYFWSYYGTVSDNT